MKLLFARSLMSVWLLLVTARFVRALYWSTTNTGGRGEKWPCPRRSPWDSDTARQNNGTEWNLGRWLGYVCMCISKTRELWSSNAAFKNAFFTVTIIITIMEKQGTLKQRNAQNGSKSANHKSQTITFLKRKLLFPKRSAKIIDGSEKRKRQSAFELQNLRVFWKRKSDSWDATSQQTLIVKSRHDLLNKKKCRIL